MTKRATNWNVKDTNYNINQYPVHFVEQTTICKSTIMKSLAAFMQGKYKVINPVYSFTYCTVTEATGIHTKLNNMNNGINSTTKCKTQRVNCRSLESADEEQSYFSIITRMKLTYQ